MSDMLDGTGLHTKSLSDLIDELTSGLQTIYGADINVDPNSPDGQLINIIAQEGIDLRELLAQINAGFDPDQAEGRVLDQRVGINNIIRAGGTYTTVNVEVTVDRALSLIGMDTESAELDPDVDGLYILRDDQGNEFYLVDSQSPAGAGTYTYEFRAAAIGNVEITVNTITTPVTVIAGVIAVNNPGGAIVQGEDEESDADLRVRRANATSIAGTGYLDSMEAALQAIENVVSARVFENDTGLVDGYGTAAHTIWAIIDGGADADIGAVIYAKKSLGCGQRGAESVAVPRTNGGTFTAYFDRPSNTDLYVEFTITFAGYYDEDDVKQEIVDNVTWSPGEDATGDVITCFLKTRFPDLTISGMGISRTASGYTEIVAATDPQERFVMATTRISIL